MLLLPKHLETSLFILVANQEPGVYRWLTPDYTYGLLTGGMTFNETTGHLLIPKNGTYYMYSTIQFQRSITLDHDVPLAVDIKIVTFTKSGLNKRRNIGFNPKYNVVIPKGHKGGTYSMHTSGVARLCENDVIYLHIQGMPEDKVVILNGRSAYTNFGTFMIAPSCQEETSTPPATDTTSSPTTSTEAQSSPTSNRCARRDCK